MIILELFSVIWKRNWNCFSILILNKDELNTPSLERSTPRCCFTQFYT